MASFYNQATLVFRGRRANSNVTSAEIIDNVVLTKTAISANYGEGDAIAYAIGITNNSAEPIAALTIRDDLGAYELSGNLVYPLDYVEGTLRLYVNGTPAPTPTVTAPPLVISNISIPSGANALIIYEARANAAAPLAQGSVITNTVTAEGGSCGALSAEASVPIRDEARPVITKFASDAEVSCGGELSYSFVIQNLGNTAVVATDNLLVEDVFNPILNISSVTLDGTALTEGTGYSYNATTGEFATLPGAIAIPAASYTADPETGVITTTPGVTVLTVTGTL